MDGKHVRVQRKHNISCKLKRVAQISNGRTGKGAVPSEANQTKNTQDS